jgi:hypothetical protein
MPRWVFAAAVLTLAFAFPASPAKAGLFSHHGGCNDCAPTCGAPSCCAPAECAPTCCAPSGCCNAAPSCGCPSGCGEVYGGCGDTGCCGDVCYNDCHECCLKKFGRKLMSLEHRKNACLKRTFLGWRNKGCGNDCCSECAPVEYYQPTCGVPACGAPCGCH